MTKVKLQEGWIHLEMVYSAGNEQWYFSKTKPDYCETYIANKGEWLPAEPIRIFYAEADNAEIEVN